MEKFFIYKWFFSEKKLRDLAKKTPHSDNKKYLKIIDSSLLHYNNIKFVTNYYSWALYKKRLKENYFVDSLGFRYKNQLIYFYHQYYTLRESSSSIDQLETESYYNFISFGVPSDSSDGEFRCFILDREYFLEYLAKYKTYIDLIYRYFVKNKLFKKYDIVVYKNQLITNKSSDIRLLTLLITLDSYNLSRLRDSNKLSSYKDFLFNIYHDMQSLLKSEYLISVYPEKYLFGREKYSIIERLLDDSYKILYPRYWEYGVELLKKTKEEYRFYIRAFNVIMNAIKVIPLNMLKTAENEINILYKINLLALNSILPTSTHIITHFYSNDNVNISNPSLLDKIKNSNNYKKVYDILSQMLDMNDRDPVIFSIRNKLQKYIYTDIYVIILLEFLGETFYNFSSQLHFYNAIDMEKSRLPTIQDAEQAPYAIYDVDNLLFSFIYKFLCFNIHLKIVHSDIHLNNITVNARDLNRSTRIHPTSSFEIMLNKLKRSEMLKRIHKNLLHMFILDSNNLDNNCFLVPGGFFNYEVIDFGRAICNTDLAPLIDLVWYLFPEKYDDIGYRNLLETEAYKNPDDFFNIICGYDTCILIYVLEYYWSVNKQNFSKIKHIENPNNLKKLKSYQKIALDTIKNHLDLFCKQKIKKVQNINLLLLNKLFDKYKLKHWDLKRFYADKKNIVPVFDPSDFSSEIFSQLILDDKLLVIDKYYLQNKIQFKSVNDLFNHILANK